MESIIIGALIGLGVMILYFAYFIIKDVEGWKGKLSRSIFYLIVGAILFVFWANNPPDFEKYIPWSAAGFIGWFCLKIVSENYDRVVERRKKEELWRYQMLINRLDEMDKKISLIIAKKDID